LLTESIDEIFLICSPFGSFCKKRKKCQKCQKRQDNKNYFYSDRTDSAAAEGVNNEQSSMRSTLIK
jgi:hypothetical protein